MDLGSRPDSKDLGSQPDSGVDPGSPVSENVVSMDVFAAVEKDSLLPSESMCAILRRVRGKGKSKVKDKGKGKDKGYGLGARGKGLMQKGGKGNRNHLVSTSCIEYSLERVIYNVGTQDETTKVNKQIGNTKSLNYTKGILNPILKETIKHV